MIDKFVLRLERWLFTIPLRLRSILRRAQVERELDEELQFHLEQRTRREIASGRTPKEALIKAVRAMEGIEQQKEACRDTWRIRYLDDLARDVQYGWRKLRKSPGFTSIAVLTLTLGIGVNTAIFSVVNGVLLRPLPYADPERLVNIYETNTMVPGRHFPLTSPNFVSLRSQARSFASIAAMDWAPSFTLSGGTDPEELRGRRITPSMLSTLGVQLTLGRNISEADTVPGEDHVVLISNRLWMSRFAADPGILGRKITLNSEPYTVIGVLPPAFRVSTGFVSASLPDLYIPLGFTKTDHKKGGIGNASNVVFAQLGPGVTLSQAKEEVNIIAARLVEEYDFNQGRNLRLNVVPLHEQVVGNHRASLLLIFAAAGVILLISCVNLANALLARGAGEKREFAVRLAMGASRWAVIRQILTQNFMLASLGCVLGVLTSFGALKVLLALAPSRLPRLYDVVIDGTTLAFAIAVSVFTALAFGLLPALQLSGLRPYDAMRGSGRSTSGSMLLRWRGALIVVQVALSVVLLVGAGLLLKSFSRLRGINPGFQQTQTMAMRVRLSRQRYPQQAERLRFFAELADRVRNLPGVEEVAYTSGLPMRTFWWGGCEVENPEVPMNTDDPLCFKQIVSSEYFRTLGIALLRGRPFDDSDRAGSQPVVMVNNAFANRYFPNSTTLGRQFRDGDRAPFSIIGVVDDVRVEGLAKPVPVEIYFPAAQAVSRSVSPSDLAVRVAGDPLQLVNAIKHEVQALDKEQPITKIQTMDEVLAQSTAERRFHTLLLVLFAALALLLAAIGIYGVVSYAVAQRKPELGLRIAVGARPIDILTLILRRITALIAIGAVIGIAAAFALSRFVESMLFDVTPRDPVTFVIATLVLLFAGLSAALLPARQATRVDPISVLRVE